MQCFKFNVLRPQAYSLYLNHENNASILLKIISFVAIKHKGDAEIY